MITIDDQEYDNEELTEQGKDNLRRLIELQREVDERQIVIRAYINTIKLELSKKEEEEDGEQ